MPPLFLHYETFLITFHSSLDYENNLFCFLEYKCFFSNIEKFPISETVFLCLKAFKFNNQIC